jgi:hypothetical protein
MMITKKANRLQQEQEDYFDLTPGSRFEKNPRCLFVERAFDLNCFLIDDSTTIFLLARYLVNMIII